MNDEAECENCIDWEEPCPRHAEPSPLWTDIEEAKAEITRLTEENDKHRADYKRRGAEIDRSRVIVEAATALRDYDAQFAYPGDEWVSRREQLVRAVVTAVEEGQKL